MLKQFYEMTREEFIDFYLKEAYKLEYGSLHGFDIWLNSPLSWQEVNCAVCNADDDHYDIIDISISRGIKVSKDVLKDYPYLIKKYLDKK